MSTERANSDRLIAEMAARQHGVVTRGQLERAGIRGSAVSYRVRAGRLHRLHRGVYAVGHVSLSFEGRCLAALLAVATDGLRNSRVVAVSHRSAAGLWGMLPPLHGPIEISISTRAGRTQRNGIAIHRAVTLSPALVKQRAGIPVTTPARTLRDLQRIGSRDRYQRAARRALDLRLVGLEALSSETELTRSELERLFLRLCRRHRLPAPEVNVRLAGLEVDFLWRDQAVVVETDGFHFHGHRMAFESDRARDARLQALGYRVLRFSYRQVRRSPRLVVSALRRAMSDAA